MLTTFEKILIDAVDALEEYYTGRAAAEITRRMAILPDEHAHLFEKFEYAVKNNYPAEQTYALIDELEHLLQEIKHKHVNAPAIRDRVSELKYTKKSRYDDREPSTAPKHVSRTESFIPFSAQPQGKTELRHPFYRGRHRTKTEPHPHIVKQEARVAFFAEALRQKTEVMAAQSEIYFDLNPNCDIDCILRREYLPKVRFEHCADWDEDIAAMDYLYQGKHGTTKDFWDLGSGNYPHNDIVFHWLKEAGLIYPFNLRTFNRLLEAPCKFLFLQELLARARIGEPVDITMVNV